MHCAGRALVEYSLSKVDKLCRLGVIDEPAEVEWHEDVVGLEAGGDHLLGHTVLVAGSESFDVEFPARARLHHQHDVVVLSGERQVRLALPKGHVGVVDDYRRASGVAGVLALLARRRVRFAELFGHKVVLARGRVGEKVVAGAYDRAVFGIDASTKRRLATAWQTAIYEHDARRADERQRKLVARVQKRELLRRILVQVDARELIVELVEIAAAAATSVTVACHRCHFFLSIL